MRGLTVLLVVLGLPALEIYGLVRLAEAIGWWLLLWLAASAALGWLLITGERVAFLGRIAAALETGNILSVLLDSGRTLIAGGLLIFPGVVSDLLALVLLLLPSQLFVRRSRPAAEKDVIEGEFKRLD